jgi:excisionase family DNA binding protein
LVLEHRLVNRDNISPLAFWARGTGTKSRLVGTGLGFTHFPKGKGNPTWSNYVLYKTGVRLLAIKEAAFVLGVGRDSVVRLIKRGKLECFEFPTMGGQGKNKKRMIPETEITRFLEWASSNRKRVA